MATCTIRSGCRPQLLIEILPGPLKESRGDMRMLAMTLETPSHVEWRKLFDPLHPLDRPMTALARDAGKHMLAVIEIDKIRKIVYLDPTNGALLLHSFLELFDFAGLPFK